MLRLFYFPITCDQPDQSKFVTHDRSQKALLFSMPRVSMVKVSLDVVEAIQGELRR